MDVPPVTESADPGDPLPPRPTQRRYIRRSDSEVPPEMTDEEREEGEEQHSGLLRELPVLVFVALALALLIKTFLVQAFFIPSDSMENTLLRGDRVLVNKFASHFGEVQRGQVVVFKDPGDWLPDDEGANRSTNPVVRGLKDVFVFVGLLPSDSEKDLIKRVIGVPGDTVECQPGGKVMVNGVALDEPYIYKDSSGNQDKPCDRQFKVTVPSNRLWVMGDHRSLSADSRVHMDEPGKGTIPSDNVVGRAFVLVWPLNRWTTLPVPQTFKRAEIDAGSLAKSSSAAALAAVPIVWVLRRRQVASVVVPVADERADVRP
jgi:signal peptidase I